MTSQKLNMVLVLCIAVMGALIGCADKAVEVDETAVAEMEDAKRFDEHVRLYLTTGDEHGLFEAAHGRAFCDYYGDSLKAAAIADEYEQTLPLILRRLRLQSELRIHEVECAAAVASQ